MKKRLLAWLLTLVLLLTLLPATALAADIPTAGGTLTSGTYVLTGNVDLSTNLTIPAEAEVTIDLNGHALIGTGTGTSSVITVEGMLNIRDGASGGSITGGNAENGGGILVKNGGQLILASGAIRQNTAKAGGGVYIEGGGHFEMTGGEISYNTSTNVKGAGGGGVAIDDGAEFNLSGGKISNNASYIQGGGVFTNGTMSMSGGEISGNKAPAGAGVMANKNTFTMTAGAIRNNVANCEDNITNGGSFNNALGGGVKAANSVFYFYGGEISGNRVESTDVTSLKNVTASVTKMGLCDGGGIHVRDSAEIHVKGTPVVKDNTNVSSTTYTDNIYFQHANVLLELDGALENGASLPIYKANGGQITFCDGYSFVSGTITSDREAVSFVKRGEDLFVGESASEEDAICYTMTDTDKYYYASFDAMVADLVAGTHDVYLMKDVQLAKTVTFSDKVDLTLRPDSGKTIKITYPNANGAFFDVPTGSILTVCGAITLDGSGVTRKNARAFDVSGTLTIGENGTADVPVIQNFAPANNTNGGAVNVSSGTLNIYSGKLTNNTAGAMGGAIFATRNSVINMTGGSIASNHSTSYGGGICVDKSILNISGGSITENAAGNNVGHGVHLFDDSVLNMDGGSVMNNSGTASQISVNHSSAKFVSGEIGLVRNAGEGIIFYTNGGDFENRADLTELPTPLKDGYKFEGWFTDAALENKAENLTAGATYYAKWTESSNVIDGKEDGERMSVDLGTIVEGQITSQTVTFKAKEGQTADPLDHVLSDSGIGYFYAKIDGMNVTISPSSSLTPGTYRDTLHVYTESGAVHFIDVTLTITPAPTPEPTPVIPVTPSAPAQLPFNPDAGKTTFTDVAGNAWYTSAVNYAVDKGLMNGTGEGKFSPEADTTRGMIVTILARLDGKNTSGTPWYQAGQRWAMEYEISDGTNMTGVITREQLVTMLFRYAVKNGLEAVTLSENLTQFTDASDISAWAVSAMQWAVGQGLIQGSNGLLRPQANASRAEVATILMRFCELLNK